jgi:hypothetical protein
MLNRIRMAMGLAGMLVLLGTSAALAKGSFAFVSVSGENLKGELRLYDTSITQDWFAFADFQQSVTAAPLTTPEGGYEITRYYIDGRRNMAFDHLHYYPRAGLVYFDGLVNGSSEYDGKWYRANTQIKGLFMNDVHVAATQEALRDMAFIRRS